MNFLEFEYQRPDKDEVLTRLQELLHQFEQAEDYAAFFNTFQQFIELEKHFQTQMQLANIRHSIDTRDEFYTQECDYFDVISPIVDLSLIHI